MSNNITSNNPQSPDEKKGIPKVCFNNFNIKPKFEDLILESNKAAMEYLRTGKQF